MKYQYAYLAFVLAATLATTSCAGAVREGEKLTDSTSSASASPVGATADLDKGEPVTLVAKLSVDGAGVRDFSRDAMVYINGEPIDNDAFVDDPASRLKIGDPDDESRAPGDNDRKYLNYDFGSSGGQAVFQARSGDEIEFVTKNYNINSIRCEVTNEHGTTLATDSAMEAENVNGKYEIDEAVCALTAP